MKKLIVGGTILAATAAGAFAQVHTTGLNILKTCPPSANEGVTVSCTITVENQDDLHGVNSLSVTNQYPLPSGPILPVPGCPTTLGASDGAIGSGPDFASCIAQETFDGPCTGVAMSVGDQAVASGVDADPTPIGSGGFGGLPVQGSVTNFVLVTCNTPTPSPTEGTVLPTPTETPEPTPTSPPIDHFKCYKVKDLKNPKFELIEDVQLDDEFGNEVVDVKKPFLVCNPASKNNSGIMDSDLHICCYKIKSSPLSPARQMEITDQFGSLEVEAKKAQMFCQPCTKVDLP